MAGPGAHHSAVAPQGGIFTTRWSGRRATNRQLLRRTAG